jgi:hypothetical protein
MPTEFVAEGAAFDQARISKTVAMALIRMQALRKSVMIR